MSTVQQLRGDAWPPRLAVQALGLLVRIWAYLMLALLAIVIWLSGFLGIFEYI